MEISKRQNQLLRLVSSYQKLKISPKKPTNTTHLNKKIKNIKV